MALTLETGTGASDSDSFVSVVECRAYAASRGLTLPTDAEVEVLLRKASDYLNSRESRFRGSRVNQEQALPFPRRGVTLYGRPFDEDKVPVAIKNAACQLAADLVDVDPLAVGSGREVVSSTVGPISTTFAVTGKTAVLPVLTKVEALLAPLYTSGSATLVVDRV